MAQPSKLKIPAGTLLSVSVSWRRADLAEVETERVGKYGGTETWRGEMNAQEVAALQVELAHQ